MAPDLLIHNLAEVATPEGSSPLRGADQRRVRRIRGAEVLCRDGRIAFVGDPEERRRLFGELPDAERLDGRGGTLIPGFVDPHTHLPWAGTREEEFAARLAGKTYQEIAAAGGGILSTVDATRRASEEELAANVRRRMDQMLACGTTTAEAKSGYGLSLDDELKQLRAIRRASESHPVDLVPTLMAAHEMPPEHRQDRDRYLDLICEEIVPATAEAGLARFCDVFCEQGVFTPEESRRVLEAGVRHGLAPRLHADEFVDSGGAELAAELGRPLGRPPDRRLTGRHRGPGALRRHRRPAPRHQLLPDEAQATPRPGGSSKPACRWRSPPTATPAPRTPSRCPWWSSSPSSSWASPSRRA